MNSFPFRLSLIALAGTVLSLLDPCQSLVGAQDFYSPGAMIQMTDYVQPVPDADTQGQPSLSDIEGTISDDSASAVPSQPPVAGEGTPLSCDTCQGSSCNSCQISPYWGSAEYMMLWGKRRALPALVSTGPAGSAGIAEVLFGDALYADEMRSSGRIQIGHWLGGCDNIGVVGSFYGVGEGVNRFQQPAVGIPVLARPFYSVDLGQDASILVNNPNEWDGYFTDASNTNEVLGAECYVRKALYKAPGYRVDLLGGYQFGRIDDSLRMASTTVAQSPDTFPVGTRWDIEDRFNAQNQFHGGTIGLLTEVRGNKVRLEMLAKIGFGNMHERVSILGSQVIREPGVDPDYRNYGLLAQASNIGEYTRDTFAVTPEAGIKLGYEVLPGLEANIGYTFMYWSSAAMAGMQVDPSIDLGGGTHPVLTRIADGDYWVQGITFGLDWEF